MFGSNANAGNSLFKSNNPFSTATNTSFGGIGNSLGTFNSQTNSNIFGSANANNNTFGNQNLGTAHAAFKQTSYRDKITVSGSVRNCHFRSHVINAMAEYNTKSLDELRLEDYAMNRRKPASSSTGLGSSFGFGSSTSATPTFGTATSNLFGTTQNTNTGQSSSLFGGNTNTQAGSGLFGNKPAVIFVISTLLMETSF